MASSARHRRRADRYRAYVESLYAAPDPEPDYQDEDDVSLQPELVFYRARRRLRGFSRHARERLELRYGVEPERSYQIAADIAAQLNNRSAVWLGPSIGCSERDCLVVRIDQVIGVCVATRELPIRVVTMLPVEAIKEYALSAAQLIAIENLLRRT